jgi:hypothetical protein
MSANQDLTVAGPEYGRADSRQSRDSQKSAGRSTSAFPETRLSSSRDSHRSKSSARKQPSYEESSLQIAGSPPLTSFLNDRHSASSAQEEAYLKHASRLRIARLVLSALTIGTAIAAVAVTSHILKSYNDTHLGSNWHLPLWPINIDIRPTLGILIPAAIITVNCLCYVILAVIPSVSHLPSLHQTK